MIPEPGSARPRLRPCCGRLAIVLVCGALLAGCGPTVARTPPSVEKNAAKKPAPQAAAPLTPVVPRTKHLGPVLDMRNWKIQCANENLAMLCRKSDRTDRRCADKRAGKYRWTYGSYCHRALACYRKACR